MSQIDICPDFTDTIPKSCTPFGPEPRISDPDTVRNLASSTVCGPGTVIPEPHSSRAYGKIFIKGIHKDVSKRDLEKLFTTVGPIQSISLRKIHAANSNTATIRFRSDDDVAQAVERFNGIYHHDFQLTVERFSPIRYRLAVDPAKNFTKIYFRSLSFATTAETLGAYCAKFGGVQATIVRPSPKCTYKYGYVTFRTHDAAKATIAATHGAVIDGLSPGDASDGMQQLSVEWFKPPSERPPKPAEAPRRAAQTTKRSADAGGADYRDNQEESVPFACSVRMPVGFRSVSTARSFTPTTPWTTSLSLHLTASPRPLNPTSRELSSISRYVPSLISSLSAADDSSSWFWFDSSSSESSSFHLIHELSSCPPPPQCE